MFLCEECGRFLNLTGGYFAPNIASLLWTSAVGADYSWFFRFQQPLVSQFHA